MNDEEKYLIPVCENDMTMNNNGECILDATDYIKPILAKRDKAVIKKFAEELIELSYRTYITPLTGKGGSFNYVNDEQIKELLKEKGIDL